LLTTDWLIRFKQATEEVWNSRPLNPAIYGFQIQPGTRWNPGLSDAEIEHYEKALQIDFPDDFRRLLGYINGTDLPTINIYGESGIPPQQSVGVYSYPRDLPHVQHRIASLNAASDRPRLFETLAEGGLSLPPDTKFAPIYEHRYVVCTKFFPQSPVVSIWDADDAIFYGDSLGDYLEREFL